MRSVAFSRQSLRMSMQSGRRTAVCLRLSALRKRCDSSESGLLWTSWSFLVARMPTLSLVYTAEREGYVCGMDTFGRGSAVLSILSDRSRAMLISSYDFDDEKFGVMTDRFDEVDGRTISICVDRDCIYYPQSNRRNMVRVSLSSGDCVEVIPVPPSTSYLTQLNCVSNGCLFAAMGHELIRTRLSPLSEHDEQPVFGRGGYTDGFGWEAVADIKLVVTGMDVIARSDGRFQLVCVGRKADPDDFATYVHHVDYEGNESLEPFEDAWLCRFVPSNDELVCVAGGLDSSDVPWISLVDIWSMSVLFVLDRPGGIGKYKKFGETWYLAAMDNRLAVVGQQRSANPFFEIMVWELQ